MHLMLNVAEPTRIKGSQDSSVSALCAFIYASLDLEMCLAQNTFSAKHQSDRIITSGRVKLFGSPSLLLL